MNILPFVIALLSVLVGLSHAIFHQNTTLRIEQLAYSSYMTAERQARIDGSRKLWDRYKEKTSKTSQTEQAIQKRKNYRQQDCYRKHGRLNIFALLHTDAPPPHLRKTLEHLLDALYSPMAEYQSLKEQGRLNLFLNEWLSSQSQNFDGVRFEDAAFQRLFYKMMRGCIYYDVDQHEGFPPLEAFVCMQQESQSTPMPWRTARQPLLRAFFGDFAEKILQREAELQEADPSRMSTLTFDEFNELASAQFITNLNLWTDLMDHRCRKQVSVTSGESDQSKPWTRVIREQ